MNQAEILKRLAVIADKYLPDPPPCNPPQDMCWLDGSKCPYGFPNGRFQDRPDHICHLGDNGCPKLKTNVDFKEMIERYLFKELQKRIEEVAETKQVDLSSELIVIAKDKLPDSPERELLELAGDIIREETLLDEKIIRVDDI